MADVLSYFLSLENLQQAWLKVAANKGCAGVDRQTIAHFAQNSDRRLIQLRQHVLNGSYRPLPLRQFFIPKTSPAAGGKPGWRELRVPAVRDRILQQALLNVLHPIFEPQFEPCSFAYRPGRSHRLAVEQITAWQRRGYDWVLDADIVKYFDHIRHDRLLAEVAERLPKKAAEKVADSRPQDERQSFQTQHPHAQSVPPLPFTLYPSAFIDLVLHLVEQWMSVGVLTPDGLWLPEQGIPQGSVVSPILANVYLDDFDEAISATNLKLVRYADDFVVLGKRQTQIRAIQEQIAEWLAEMGLQLHAGKTQITHFDRGFKFLGHTFVGDLVVPVKPRRKKRQVNRSESSQAHPRSPDIRVVHADPPAQSSAMQQAMVEALKQSERPIPPPLFVVLGYQVRPIKPVEIKSNETIWREGMSTLYLVQQGATVNKSQGRFLVKAPKEAPLEIPAREVKRMLVFGNIQLTTAIISDCLSQQIPVVFLSQLGDYKGHLWSAENDDIRVEKVQYQRQDDGAFQLTTARAIVQGKLLNSKQLLLRLNRKRQLDAVKGAIAGLDRDLAALPHTETLDQLRGYEGSAATRYFRALGQLITNPAFTFTERNRRPPKDPVNSLLSFGYTLLYNNVLSLILAEGLNPYLGNLHGSEKKQTFLAFDLTEEFRSPVVDSLVMRLINQKFFKPTDFTWPNESGGIYLNDAARRPFLKQFEERLSQTVQHPDVSEPVSYRRIIQLQIKRYKQALLNDIPYEAYRKVK